MCQKGPQNPTNTPHNSYKGPGHTRCGGFLLKNSTFAAINAEPVHPTTSMTSHNLNIQVDALALGGPAVAEAHEIQ